MKHAAIGIKYEDRLYVDGAAESGGKAKIAGLVWAKEPQGDCGWKLRSKMNDLNRWYDLPEEVDGGP